MDQYQKISEIKLEKGYYFHDDVVFMARDLIGKILVTNIDGQVTKAIIVETEAYRGYDDKACHASNGRRTKRNEIMYARGGKAYVYLCYGVHHLFNVVTNTEDNADAVLIRALEPVEGEKYILGRFEKPRKLLANGPGVLSRAMGISTKMNGKDLYGDLIWLEKGLVDKDKMEIVEAKRVGVGYAEEDADLPWRFYLKGNMNVSRL